MTDLSDEALTKLRYVIDDTDSSAYKYTDNRLTTLLSVSATYVKDDISADYTVNLSGGTISPDIEDIVVNLIVLKSACLLTKSEYKSSSQCAVRFTDGPSTADYKGVADSLKEAAKNFCEDYTRAMMYYLTGQSDSIALISTPNNG